MSQATCNSIRDSLLAYLGKQISVHTVDSDCIITVPMNTLDNRWVDVTVEEKSPGFFLVHDSGKASDELFLQGVSISDKKSDIFRTIANRYAVDLDDGRFLVGCKADHLQHSIWAIAHCSSLAMGELLRHKPSVEDEAVRAAVGNIITSWGSERNVRVQKNVSALGQTAQHVFDFIADDGNSKIAVNVLNPGQSSIGRAQRYGFQGLDLRDSHTSFRNLAVLAHPEVWSESAKSIVGKMANRTVEYSAPLAPVMIYQSLDELRGKAA
jgi:hypothetical protein